LLATNKELLGLFCEFRKANDISEGSRTAFSVEGLHYRNLATLAFGFFRNCSISSTQTIRIEADAAGCRARMNVPGEGGSPCPASVRTQFQRQICARLVQNPGEINNLASYAMLYGLETNRRDVSNEV